MLLALSGGAASGRADADRPVIVLAPVTNLPESARNGDVVAEAFAATGATVLRAGDEASFREGLKRAQAQGGATAYFSGHCEQSAAGLDLVLPASERSPEARIPFASLAARKGRWIWILDCCYAARAALSPRPTQADSRQWLLAAGRGRLPDDPRFASLLADGVTSGLADRNCDGDITLDEMGQFLDSRLARDRPSAGWGTALKADGPEEAVLVRGARPQSAQPPPPACTPWAAVNRARATLLAWLDGTNSPPGWLRTLPKELAEGVRTTLGGEEVAPQPPRVCLLRGQPGELPTSCTIGIDLRARPHDPPAAALSEALGDALRRFTTVLEITFSAGGVEIVDLNLDWTRACAGAPGAADCAAGPQEVAVESESPLVLRFPGRGPPAAEFSLRFSAGTDGICSATPVPANWILDATPCRRRRGHCIQVRNPISATCLEKRDAVKVVP